METGGIAAIIVASVAVFGSIGATVRWASVRFEKLSDALNKLQSEYAMLYRENSLVLVRLERFRFAFQIVASELARRSPGNYALSQAAALLDEAFKIEPDLPDEIKIILERIDGAERDNREARTAREGRP